MRIVFFAFVLLAVPAVAQEFTAPAKAPNEPDHLVPIIPRCDLELTKYYKSMRKKLEVSDEPEPLVMIFQPAFEGEEYLVIRGPMDGPFYEIIHTRADKNIWYAMPEHSNDGKRSKVTVVRRDAMLPAGMAERVFQLWERMIRGMRYPIPNEVVAIADGVTSEFWRFNMCAETVSPDGGAPWILVELGRSLMNYCDAPEDQRAKALKEVEMRCQALEQHLDKKLAR